MVSGWYVTGLAGLWMVCGWFGWFVGGLDDLWLVWLVLGGFEFYSSRHHG